jgi:hypothetical protein
MMMTIMTAELQVRVTASREEEKAITVQIDGSTEGALSLGV